MMFCKSEVMVGWRGSSSRGRGTVEMRAVGLDMDMDMRPPSASGSPADLFQHLHQPSMCPM